MDITGKTAIVTGAAVGSGRAIAQRLAAEGARVMLADVDMAGLAETQASIGHRARIVRTDMTDPAEIEQMIAAVGDTLDVLVNNAGGGGHLEPNFPRATPAEWGASLDLNLRGPMLATQYALAPMRAAGGGAVVNIGSSAGIGHAPHQSPEYSAAKAGLARFTSTLAPLRESMNVRVNCVAPDWLGTERAMRELAAMSEDERKSLPEPIPLDVFTDAVVRCIVDDTLAGQIIALWPDHSELV
jgi:NAD(P)-dependent dehydrogenase (short-subunit alcohol dehydrogenase family)